MMRVLVIAAVLLATLLGCRRKPPPIAPQPAPVPAPAVTPTPTQQTSPPQAAPPPQPAKQTSPARQPQQPTHTEQPQRPPLVVDARQASIRQTVVDATCSPFLSVVLRRDGQPNLVVDSKGRISHGTATAKMGNVDIENSFQLRRVSVPEGYWMLQVSPRGEYRQEFIDAAEAPLVRDAEGNEYAPFGSVVDDKDIHYVDLRPTGEGIAAIPQPPTGRAVDLCLLYRIPVGRVVSEAVVDRQVVFRFSPPLDDHSQ
jgi:hypothetical protein